MAFDDLNIDEQELIADLVEHLSSGDFSPRFAITPMGGARCAINLKGVGGAADVEIVVSQSGHVETLKDAGYLSIVRSEPGYVGELSARAYEAYKSVESSPAVFGLIPMGNHVSKFDDQLLERIAKRSEQLLKDLRKNFELYRRQASLSFVWTLVISTVGMILLSSGIALSLIGKASTVNVASISGVLTEFLAAIFFKQAAAARNSQDRCQQDLLRRQQILDLVELTRLISDEKSRDAVTQDLIKGFVLGTGHGKALQDKE
jgi:hypothetical protein